MSTTPMTPGIQPARLPGETLARNFCDLHAPLERHEAQVAADRCYFCHDAPCMTACPTSIDVPLFIRQIMTGTPEAAAKTIFSQNILGGMCARVCPTEQLCEEACVREAAEGRPVEIGRLQRYATDTLMARNSHPFTRAEPTGKRVAVVGAGPAGLACAHRLAMKGHEVVVYDHKAKAGGLNEFGIAAYKSTDDFAAREVAWLLGIGGITVETGKGFGAGLELEALQESFDAVFLGIGLGGVNALRAMGEDKAGVEDAVSFIAELRQAPDRAVIVSIMVPCEEEAWKAILPLVEETGADGIELNFGCPHGMAERGMGSAVGQVPEYIRMVAQWCKTYYSKPVIVKLTPNITDIRYPARAAFAGGADAVSLINTINSITSVNLDAMCPEPMIDGKGSHGGYCGPAVKPIALNMVAEIARDPETAGKPISGIGGITTWRDAAEFKALGAGNVQVCTAAMTYGFKVVQEMISGLSQWMDEKGYESTADFIGMAVPRVSDWQHLNLNYVTKAEIDQDACIKCGRCYAACEDTSHQAIDMSEDRVFSVKDEDCVACNLCVNVCPVEGCITMRQLEEGEVDPRTGQVVGPYANWTTHPNNPGAVAAE